MGIRGRREGNTLNCGSLLAAEGIDVSVDKLRDGPREGSGQSVAKEARAYGEELEKSPVEEGVLLREAPELPADCIAG